MTGSWRWTVSWCWHRQIEILLHLYDWLLEVNCFMMLTQTDRDSSSFTWLALGGELFHDVNTDRDSSFIWLALGGEHCWTVFELGLPLTRTLSDLAAAVSERGLLLCFQPATTRIPWWELTAGGWGVRSSPCTIGAGRPRGQASVPVAWRKRDVWAAVRHATVTPVCPPRPRIWVSDLWR